MHAKLAKEDQMTIEEFLAFTDQRPDGERWELIEGMAIMNASPTDFHQLIAGNILAALMLLQEQNDASWVPIIGVGTRVPVQPNSLPQPDVMVKEKALSGKPVSDEALVLFEVISPGNSVADQAWRRRVYASVPNCRHYVTVSQKKIDVTRYDRASTWKPITLDKIGMSLDLEALGISIPLARIYRGTQVAPRKAR